MLLYTLFTDYSITLQSDSASLSPFTEYDAYLAQ